MAYMRKRSSLRAAWLGWTTPSRKGATSNSVQVIVAKAETSRSIIGIVDGLSSVAIEREDDKQNRSKLLRDLGNKK